MKIHFHWLDAETCPRHLGLHAQRDAFVGLNSNDEHVLLGRFFVEKNERRFFKMHGDVRARFRQPFSDAHVNGHVPPTPIVHVEPERDESFRD